MAVRTIEVREKVMARNDELAAAVRRRRYYLGVTALNLVSSPGAGKTTLLYTLSKMGTSSSTGKQSTVDSLSN